MPDQRELQLAAEHFRRRALALDRARSEIWEVRPQPAEFPERRVERETRAQKMIETAKALREAGRLTLPEFVAHTGFLAVTLVHHRRVVEGDYDDELEPIRIALEEVKAANELGPDQYWPRGEGPAEWRDLNDQYERALEKQQVSVLREFGLNELAAILEDQPERFHELWLRGVKAARSLVPPEERLSALISTYHQESLAAEAAGAYHAAAALRGAMLEGVLLLRCIRNPEAVESARRKLPPGEQPSGIVEKWTLGQLINVSRSAGWLPELSVEGQQVDISIYAQLVRDLRNMLHPGRMLETPKAELTLEELTDARAAITVIEVVLETLDAA